MIFTLVAFIAVLLGFRDLIVVGIFIDVLNLIFITLLTALRKHEFKTKEEN